MRVLIIDNYDSFTFNLVSYVESIIGEPPTVIHNDEPGWDVQRTEDFDAIIISPGPGHPKNTSDFGICAAVIEHTSVPLLGVCLGHQGIALSAGGIVELAPDPVHGQVSEIRHDGSELFEGIPQICEVVRYHSMIVSHLPEQISATARTVDGLIMALQHKTRPMWGVQFHPESIGGQYGHKLIENFMGLARQHGYRWEVTEQELELSVDSAKVFETLFAESTTAFWLDDPAGSSYLGDASGPYARTTTYSLSDQDSFFDWLKNDLRQNRVAPGSGFQLGWVGYLGYELKAECGVDNAHVSAYPDAQLIFVDRVIVVEEDRVILRALGDQQDWFDSIVQALGQLKSIAYGSLPEIELHLRDSKAEYLDKIAQAKELIRRGESYEICLTTQLFASVDIDPLAAYLQLRADNPTSYSSFLRFPQLSILSSSPERFLTISASGRVESKPIKGTRPRGASHEQDQAIIRDLATNPKDRAENLMIVDLVRHDLARAAQATSVSVEKLFHVETYATVHQLVSTVSAELGNHDPIDCVRSAFPGGSMTGAPKVRTMEIIDALESGPRGVYSGGIGYFSLDGSIDLAMVIRTIVVSPNRIEYGVGGAVLALSDAAAEWEEIKVKSTPLLRLVGTQFP